MSTTPYPSTELVKLCQTETLGILHHDHRSIRYIDSNFDNGCRYQNLDRILCKCLHDLILFRLFHPSMKCRHPDLVSHLTLQKLCVIKYIFRVHRFTLFYHRTDHITLPSFGNLFLHKPVSSRPITGVNHTVFDRQAVCRKLIDHRDIQVPV